MIMESPLQNWERKFNFNGHLLYTVKIFEGAKEFDFKILSINWPMKIFLGVQENFNTLTVQEIWIVLILIKKWFWMASNVWKIVSQINQEILNKMVLLNILNRYNIQHHNDKFWINFRFCLRTEYWVQLRIPLDTKWTVLR